MPRRPISDAHERINEIPTVPIFLSSSGSPAGSGGSRRCPDKVRENSEKMVSSGLSLSVSSSGTLQGHPIAKKTAWNSTFNNENRTLIPLHPS